jgi:alkylation response protein AidB-like acyl-CoA dehydrogenase/predicted heme/steroid binding protein
MSLRLSKEDVASHNKPAESLYVIIDDDVYDLTQFQEEHPGGKKILQRMAGKDASKSFWKYHNESILKKYQRLRIGSLNTKPEPAAPQPAAPQPAASADAEPEEYEALEQYGDLVPYADPSWYQTYHSVHYNQSHADLRHEVRTFVDEFIAPYVDEWEEARVIPPEIYKLMGDRGYLAGIMGSDKYPLEYVNKSVKSVRPEDWDLFHELIIGDELSRAGSGGVVWNLLGGLAIGCPPVMKFGSEALKKRILPGILSGEKRICLAVTEPEGGSDVANLGCEAKLSADGTHYIVNGSKKWITNGIWADYFTTVVRTGKPGMNGLSVLLIERSAGGVETRKMDCQGVWSSGTTFVTFDDVKVPVENLIGNANGGFPVIMMNFNHERST